MLMQLTATLKIEAYLLFWMTAFCIVFSLMFLSAYGEERKKQVSLWRLTRNEVLPESQSRQLDRYMPLAPPSKA